MATNRQIEANRKNAQLCTGPKSEAGRATSSQNALKTGLDARSDVLRFESRPEYKVLIASFHDRFHPTIPEECALVNMLIRSEWLLRRYTSIETAVWESGFSESNEPFLGDTFMKSHEVFERVGRRMNWAQRNYQLALKQLLEIHEKRAVRAKRDAEPEPEPVIESEIVPEPAAPEPETEPFNLKLVSFLPRAPQSPAPTINTPSTSPEPEENPPTAA